MYTFDPIALVKNELKEKHFVKNAGDIISEIVVSERFVDGLLRIEEQNYIDVVFAFHQSDDYKLITPIFNGEIRGVFASRSPNRPNGIGVTTVCLLERRDNTLIVSGLDALDGTPVLDLKPADFSFYRNLESIKDSTVFSPRINIEKHISRGEVRALLHQAGQIHGHYCPGLAMGVIGTTHVMNILRQTSDGMEDLLAMVETNNCFSDGVQFVSGCTFGNNALIFHDFGKNAVTIATRKGSGVRVRAKNDIREVIGRYSPEFNPLFETVVKEKNHTPELKQKFGAVSREASFGMLEIPFDEMFEVNDAQVEIPDYAPIEASAICDECGEVFMSSRGATKNGSVSCHACSNIRQAFLDGYGIHC